jgi:F-type H+-transporting ATPase subunit gamma
MPSLKDIRKRITSVKSTQKITRAMKLVAAARLRRAQENIINARPYANKLHELISELALRADAEDHPLLEVREPRRIMVVVLTSDRGLCGGFNTNILRTLLTKRAEFDEQYDEVRLAVVGRKGRDYLKHRNVAIHKYFQGLDVNTALDRAKEISDGIIEDFLAHDLDMVYLLYNEFKSAMSQRIELEQLLPIVPLELDEVEGSQIDFVYEPSKIELLETILPMYVHVETYRAALESTASEFGARMTAMENATNNASDMISALTLEFNKARQASITKELLDIVGGAEALK